MESTPKLLVIKLFTGQITSLDIFYDLFYTDVTKQNPRDYDYCKYSRRGFDFPLYGALVYLVGSLASILAYPIARRYGRRKSIIIAAIILFIGGVVGIFYPVVLGVGIGFGSQVNRLIHYVDFNVCLFFFFQ